MIKGNIKTNVSFLAAVDRSINAPFSILLRSLRLSLIVEHIPRQKPTLHTNDTWRAHAFGLCGNIAVVSISLL